MSAAEEIARLEGVGRRYPGAADFALAPVDLVLGPGSWTAVTGRSGAGKSTLLQLLAGLDRPDVGRLWLFGREAGDASEAVLTEIRRAHVGIVYQEPLFLEHLPVWQNVTCRLVPRGVSARERRSRARAALANLGLEHGLERLPRTLSGGERQRVSLARATIDDPRLILLDEPTSNVDAETGARIVAQLRERHAAGATVVVATHDPTLIEPAERVLTLSAGVLQPASA